MATAKPRKARAKRVAVAGGVAYVICPIGPAKSDIRTRADEIMDFIIAPAVAELNLKPDRSDKEPSPGSITRQIVKSITEARVVIADLSLRNPNVFYELGVAHSFRRPVVLLIDDPDKLPFDVQHERVIELGSEGLVSLTDAKRALSELVAALTVVLGEGYEPASIVTDVVRTQTVSQLESTDPSAARLETLSAELAYVRGRLRSVEEKLDRTTTFGPSFHIGRYYPAPISGTGSRVLGGTSGHTYDPSLRVGDAGGGLVVSSQATDMDVQILSGETDQGGAGVVTGTSAIRRPRTK